VIEAQQKQIDEMQQRLSQLEAMMQTLAAKR